MPYKNCAHCGKEFYTYPSQAHRVNCCSTECGYAHKRDTRTCEYCNKTFTTNKKRTRRFCSRECASKSTNHSHPTGKNPDRYVTLYCEWCNKEYTRLKYFVENGRVSRFCSRACLGKWHSATLKGEHSALWKGGEKLPRGKNWINQKTAALKRDNYTCQICHAKNGKKKYFMHVHHIIPFKYFEGDTVKANDLSNLITLCYKCHKKVEKGLLACPVHLL